MKAIEPDTAHVAGQFIRDVIRLCELAKDTPRLKSAAEFVRFMAEPYRHQCDGVAERTDPVLLAEIGRRDTDKLARQLVDDPTYGDRL